MPIYEYECTHCKQHVDILQKLSDKPAQICPHCSSPTLVKQVSAAGFQLKGSGWYATDFKNKDKKPPETATTKTSDTKTTTDKPPKSETTN